jgi:hypothetical protein
MVGSTIRSGHQTQETTKVINQRSQGFYRAIKQKIHRLVDIIESHTHTITHKLRTESLTFWNLGNF